jgi:hypothetical protein
MVYVLLKANTLSLKSEEEELQAQCKKNRQEFIKKLVCEHNEDSEDDGFGPAGVMSPASKKEVDDLVADLLKSTGTGECLPFFVPGDT